MRFLQCKQVYTDLNLNRTSLLFIIICSLILVSFLIWGDTESDIAHQLLTLTTDKWHYAVCSYFLLASDIILPIPNSIILYANGFVLGSLAGASLSVFSLMTGAVAGYYLGKLTTYGRRVAADTQAIAFWEKYGVLAILVTRGIPVVSESICIIGGHVRMPFGKYLLMNLIGYIPISLLFALFGRFGYDQRAFLFSLACSFVFAGLFWWWGKKWI